MNILIHIIYIHLICINSLNFNRNNRNFKILSLQGPFYIPKNVKTIKDVKKYLKDRYNRDYIEIYQDGTKLSDDETCLKEHTNLHTISPIRGGMNISVETLSGKTIQMEVTENETILDVKKKLKEKQNIPVDQQRIIYEGKLLQDNKTLADYNIKVS